ncbi:MAG: DUF4136 domain-containing protein [Candidatus Puniceispirillaceae bacterium]
MLLRNLFNCLALLFCLSLLSGCMGTRVHGQVSSFSSLTSTSYGEPFVILPSDQQANSAEFSSYSASLSRRLSRQGWYRVNSIDEAKYVVLIDYGVAGSREISGSVPIYGQTGGGTTTHSGTFNTYGSGYGSSSYGNYSGTSYSMPTYGVVGSRSYSRTEYERYFQMKVIDTFNDNPVYETKVASAGSSATFGLVAECIFDLALDNFPYGGNKSGVVMLDQCGK